MSIPEVCGNCQRVYVEKSGRGTCTLETGPANIGAVDLTEDPAHNYRISTLPGDRVIWEKYYEAEGRTCFVPKPSLVEKQTRASS